MRHRARELMVGQRTAALNALRGHLSEIGVVAAQGVQNAYALKRLACDGFDDSGEIVVPDCVRLALAPLVRQIDGLDEAIEAIDKELEASAKADETARRLMTIPGVGPVTASAPLATVQDFGAFCEREGVRRLPGAHAARAIDRRQAAARAHHQDGRPLFSRKLLVQGACSALGRRKAIPTPCAAGRATCSNARPSNTSSC